MTTRALVHSHEGYRDWNLARENLRKRAIREQFKVGDETFYIAVEPLIKKWSDGRLMQTVRVRSKNRKNVTDALGKPIITSASGETISEIGRAHV